MSSTFTPTAVVAMAVSSVIGLCSCAPPPEEPDGEPSLDVTTDSAVAELVPADIRERGSLVIGTNAPYPPLEYFAEDNETLIGFDIDLGNSIAATMGLSAEWKNVSFDNLIPGLAGGRYDIGIAGFGIESDRLEEVDFVSYYLNGGGFFVKSDSDHRPVGFDESLCGLRIAVQKGSSQVKRLDAAQKACSDAGRPTVDVLQIPDQTQVALTLTSGRADAVVADLAAVEYAVAQSDDALCISGLYTTAHSLAGIAVPKDGESDEMTASVKAALDVLEEAGVYDEIAEKWGVVDGAVDEFEVIIDPGAVSKSEEVSPFSPKEGCGS